MCVCEYGLWCIWAASGLAHAFRGLVLPKQLAWCSSNCPNMFGIRFGRPYAKLSSIQTFYCFQCGMNWIQESNDNSKWFSVQERMQLKLTKFTINLHLFTIHIETWKPHIFVYNIFSRTNWTTLDEYIDEFYSNQSGICGVSKSCNFLSVHAFNVNKFKTAVNIKYEKCTIKINVRVIFVWLVCVGLLFHVLRCVMWCGMCACVLDRRRGMLRTVGD